MGRSAVGASHRLHLHHGVATVNADEMFCHANRVATAAEAAAKGNYSDAKQVLHMALCVVHANENTAKEAERAAKARAASQASPKMPGRPR